MIETSNQKRRKKLLKGIEEGKSIRRSAIDAGYTENYANVRGRKLLKTALKEEVKETLAILENKETVIGKEEVKRYMHDLVGMSKEEVLETIRKIATQDRDYSSALKVITPLAKEIGVILQEEEARTIVPILNIGIREITPTIEAIESVEAIATPTEEVGTAG
jgi:phage terminase small subunit